LSFSCIGSIVIGSGGLLWFAAGVIGDMELYGETYVIELGDMAALEAGLVTKIGAPVGV
jgi:hypothetical protein